MLRFMVWVLMFLVVFLSGMLLGVERGYSPSDSSVEPFIGKEVIVEDTTTLEDDMIVTDHIVEVEAPVHFTQKTASLLEAGVSGFYEVIVTLLYHIASLFF